MTNKNHTSIVATELKNMGFDTAVCQHYVIASLNRKLDAIEVEMAIAQAGLPELEVKRLMNGKVAIDCRA